MGRITWAAAITLLVLLFAAAATSGWWPDASSRLLGLAAAAAAVAFLGGTAHTVRIGQARWRQGTVIKRAERPGAFWTVVAASLLGAGLCLIFAVRLLAPA